MCSSSVFAGAIPAVADAFAWIDAVFAEAGYAAVSGLAVVQAVITAAVILGYLKYRAVAW